MTEWLECFMIVIPAKAGVEMAGLFHPRRSGERRNSVKKSRGMKSCSALHASVLLDSGLRRNDGEVSE
jgi:hypothetical protein